MQCLQRWMKVLTPGLVKGPWSPEEDTMLVALVNKNYKNWGDLALDMPGRTSKQCRERWCHALDPAIVKGAYTAEEVRIAAPGIALLRRLANVALCSLQKN